MTDHPSEFADRPPPVGPPTNLIPPPSEPVSGLPTEPAPIFSSSDVHASASVDASMGARKVRPWWGLGDVAMAVPLIIFASVIGALLATPFAGVDDLTDADQLATSSAILIGGLFAQQLVQGFWPVVVSKWKGFGPRRDWGLTIKPIDLLYGPLIAIAAMIAAGIVGQAVATAVSLADGNEASNVQILSDAADSPWLYALLFAVVIGAPVTEEIFFRGLVMRAFQKRGGDLLAVVGSSAVFALPHMIDTTVDGLAVLLSSIFTVGLVLALVALKTKRLGPPIVAHILFNATSAAAAVGWISF